MRWKWWKKGGTGGGNGDVQKMKEMKKESHSEDVHALHQSISDPSRKTLLFFSARGCRLCAAVRGPATSEAAMAMAMATRDHHRRQGVVDFMEMDAGAAAWRPEVTQFKITRVPCFVLLAEDGMARCKTSDAVAASGNKDKVVHALRLLLDASSKSSS